MRLSALKSYHAGTMGRIVEAIGSVMYVKPEESES